MKKTSINSLPNILVIASGAWLGGVIGWLLGSLAFGRILTSSNSSVNGFVFLTLLTLTLLSAGIIGAAIAYAIRPGRHH